MGYRGDEMSSSTFLSRIRRCIQTQVMVHTGDFVADSKRYENFIVKPDPVHGVAISDEQCRSLLGGIIDVFGSGLSDLRSEFVAQKANIFEEVEQFFIEDEGTGEGVHECQEESGKTKIHAERIQGMLAFVDDCMKIVASVSEGSYEAYESVVTANLAQKRTYPTNKYFSVLAK